MSPRSFADYERTTNLIVKHYGKTKPLVDIRQDDFASLRDKMAKRLGPVSLGNEINRIRIAFRFAFEMGLVDIQVRFGPGFERPSKSRYDQTRSRRASSSSWQTKFAG